MQKTSNAFKQQQFKNNKDCHKATLLKQQKHMEKASGHLKHTTSDAAMRCRSCRSCWRVLPGNGAALSPTWASPTHGNKTESQKPRKPETCHTARYAKYIMASQPARWPHIRPSEVQDLPVQQAHQEHAMRHNIQRLIAKTHTRALQN